MENPRNPEKQRLLSYEKLPSQSFRTPIKIVIEIIDFFIMALIVNS